MFPHMNELLELSSITHFLSAVYLLRTSFPDSVSHSAALTSELSEADDSYLPLPSSMLLHTRLQIRRHVSPHQTMVVILRTDVLHPKRSHLNIPFGGQHLQNFCRHLNENNFLPLVVD